MKNLFKSMMLVAVAAMGFTACSKDAVEEVNPAVESKTYTMTFVADAPNTRTSVAIEGDVAKYSWSTGDKVGFYYVATDADYKKKGNSEAAVIADNGSATFTATFTATEGAASYNIGAFFPGNSWANSHADADYFNNVKVKLPQAQALTKDTFDPAADLMMSKPFMEVALNNEAKTLEFTRIAAVGKMNLKLDGMVEGETIKTVVFTLAEGSHFNGPVTLDLENSTYTLGEANTTNTVILTGELTADADRTAIFFTCFPGEYSGEYTIEVTTDKAEYSKTGTLSKALSFTAGDVLSFNATVGNRQEVEVDSNDYSGDYYILAKRSSGNFWYATDDLGTADAKRYQAVDAGSTEIDNVDLTKAAVWTIEATGEGTYYLKAGDQFAVWGSGNSGNLSNTADETFTIDKNDDGTYYIHFAASDAERYFALNETSGNNYFAFYKNTQIINLYLVPADGSAGGGGEEPDPTPDPGTGDEPGQDELGEAWQYELSTKTSAENSWSKLFGSTTNNTFNVNPSTYTLTMDELTWSATVTTNDSQIYLAGQQIGSSKNDIKEFTLSTGNYVGAIKTISATTSSNSTAATLSVYVENTLIETKTLSSSPTENIFTLTTPKSGTIKLVWATGEANKNITITNLSINNN